MIAPPKQKEIGPKEVQEAAHRGIKRLQNFRSARLMFLRNYTGQYYDRERGEIGSEALNLIFNAIRALVPNVVMSFPKHRATSDYLYQRPYGDLLALALSQHDKKIDIKTRYRRVIVDAIFTVGAFKTGLAQSDSLYAINDEDTIDSGTIYSEIVDFDNLIIDPRCKEHLFIDAAFIGDKTCVSRQKLLDSGLYKNDLVERLPKAGYKKTDDAYKLSMREIEDTYDNSLEDEVEVIELWVPGAKQIVTIPADENVNFDDFLRIEDYYGVDEGPYTFLSLTTPVPGNPLPVPMVGIWNDLHVLANKMAKKITDQALRQKDIVAYRRAAADDAEMMKNAADGDAVATDDPDGVQVKSFGGQQNSNEVYLGQLNMWFQMMAANPDRMAGAQDNADTATQARILQSNATVGLDDMKDLVYAFGADEARKRAWYLHTDPLIELPLVRRQFVPASFLQTPTGPIMTAPARMEEQQVMLTPEARRGDFLDFAFSFEPDSMGRVDSHTRFEQAMNFVIKVFPAVATACAALLQMGVQASPQAMIIRLGKEGGIDWLEEVFADPQFQQQVQQQMMLMQQGPQMQGSKGTVAPNAGLQGAGGGLMDQVLQNGQPASVGAGIAPPQTQERSQQQQGIQQPQY